jgi:hypothetical protein
MEIFEGKMVSLSGLHEPASLTDCNFLPLSDKELLQVGYNLGRIAEITGWGRAVWDRMKQPIQDRHWAACTMLLGFMSNYATGLAQVLDDEEY